jgi:high-affinity iron transporter
MSRAGRIGLGVAAAMLVAALGGLVASARDGDASGDRIVVSETGCAPGFVAPRAGRAVLTVANTSERTTYSVDLVGADQVSVFGEIETLAPGTHATMDTVLAPGRYALECESFEGGSLYSPVVQVQGPAVSGTHAFTPVSSDQLHLATLAYRARVIPVLERLQRDTDALTDAVDAGRLGPARTLWLPAHLDYERLGAVYGTFGELDAKIDGRPSGPRGGVSDPRFQGFLRLEYGLWHGGTSTELRPVADALGRAVHTLVLQFPRLPTDNRDLALRAHEILENSLQFELTGRIDEGSHSTLATVWANVQGTQLALAALAPLLRVHSPELVSKAATGLERLGTMLRSYTRADGSWRSLESLSAPQREQLNGATSALVEVLSLVPDRLELPRRPPSGNDEDRSHD